MNDTDTATRRDMRPQTGDDARIAVERDLQRAFNGPDQPGNGIASDTKNATNPKPQRTRGVQIIRL